MMKEKRKGMLQRGIMVAVSALTVVASAGTVMAYQPAQSSDESFEEFISDDSIYDFGFDDVNDSILNFIDTVYVDADGNEMVCQESSDTYALCTHSMIPATFYTDLPCVSSVSCNLRKTQIPKKSLHCLMFSMPYHHIEAASEPHQNHSA